MPPEPDALNRFCATKKKKGGLLHEEEPPGMLARETCYRSRKFTSMVA